MCQLLLSGNASVSTVVVRQCECVNCCCQAMRVCQLLLSGNASVSCSTRHRPVKFIGGVPRLVTPKLVAVTSAHFNCSTHGLVNDFGPILQMQVGISHVPLVESVDVYLTACQTCWCSSSYSVGCSSVEVQWLELQTFD